MQPDPTAIPLVCPACRSRGNTCVVGDLVSATDGEFCCGRCRRAYPILNGIPVMVPPEQRGDIYIPGQEVTEEYQTFETGATRRVARLVSRQSSGLSLDVGCGKGPYSSYFTGELVFVDLNHYFVSEALRRYTGPGTPRGVVADLRRLPFPDGLFDFVFCSNVIEHLSEEDVRSTLESLEALTRGILQIDVPNETGAIWRLRKALTAASVYDIGIFEDSALMHGSQFGPRLLRGFGFEVHGCIGWVSRSRIKVGPLWDLYDALVWRLPSLAGTLIGIHVKTRKSKAVPVGDDDRGHSAYETFPGAGELE